MKKLYAVLATAALAAPMAMAQNQVYLIGQPQGWNINSGEMALKENPVGSSQYVGEFEIPANAFSFRFYTALGDWESHSIGSQIPDQPIDIQSEFSYDADGYYAIVDVYAGKGTYFIPNWPGGKLKIQLDLDSYTVRFLTNVDVPNIEAPSGEMSTLYVRGGFNDWDTNEEYAFNETDEENVYKASFPLEAGTWAFKIADQYWANWNLGAGSDSIFIDSYPAVVTLVNNSNSGDMTLVWKGGTAIFTINTASLVMTVTEDNIETGIDNLNAENDVNVYNLHGVKVANDLNNLPNGIYIINGRKVIVR